MGEYLIASDSNADYFVPGQEGSSPEAVGSESLVEISSADLQLLHEDIQALHWSVMCIYVICMFCWICKQWG